MRVAQPNHDHNNLKRMLDQNLHRLLRRQLKKFGKDLIENPECGAFLEAIDRAYKSFDKDIKHAEHILEESSKELYLANLKIKAERDETMEKLENIVDNINGVIFETDLQGYFTFLNNSWTETTGIPIRESLGRHYSEFLSSKNDDENKCIHDLFSAKDEEVKFIFKHKIRRQVYWFELKTKLVRDKTLKATGYIGTIIDVTALKNSQIKLKQAAKSKDEFLSTMSHEIRTPLNAVTGISNILLMENYLPAQADNLKALKYSSEHLLGLINDLLDFDKIKSGKVKIVKSNFSLSIFLENIKSHFSLRAKEKGISFRVVCDESIPNYIIGDKLKLTQVVKNLLSNSLKFTEKGGITLSLKKVEQNSKKVKIRFKVIDTGIGIPKKKLSSIFKSFVQASADTSIKYGGTGLGLPISKKLLNLQGSDLKVKSKEGKGAEFSFLIEYKIKSSGHFEEKEEVKFKTNFNELNINVLVAEDNKMNVLILKKFFSNWGVDATIAQNGQEAIERIKEKRFDIVLMDLQMPILDGYQATRAIRNLKNCEKSSVPIYALTAFAQTDIKEKTEHFKMNGFMSKPFDPEKLYRLLKKYSKKLVEAS